MAAAPAVDNTKGAAAADVLSGRTFWGLRTGGGWGLKNGSVAAGSNVTGGNGLYSGGKTATATDVNLITGNIRSGAAIFGVSGKASVVDTAGGTAVAGDMLTGKTAYVNGAQVTGAAAAGGNVTGANGSLSITIPDGLYSGSKSAMAADSNLVSANIWGGVTIFGVKGSTNPINASGITTWSDNTQNGLTAPPAWFPRQDADTVLNGFIFTKLDAATGAPLGSGAVSWGCVRDGVTGLTWENKTADSGLHHNAWIYTWYNSDAANNGDSAGTSSGGSCGGTVAAGCDTEKFVAAVNSAGWCGFTDWRIPTMDELRSIVNLGRSSPSISTNWFPNTQSSYFWSGSPYAGYSDFAWYVLFYYGSGYYGAKSNAFFVRLVRGGQ